MCVLVGKVCQCEGFRVFFCAKEDNKNEGPKSGHFRRTKVVEPPGHSFTTATAQPEVGRMSSNNSSSSTTTHSNNSGGAGTSSIEAEYNEIELRNGWCGVFQVGGQKRKKHWAPYTSFVVGVNWTAKILFLEGSSNFMLKF